MSFPKEKLFKSRAQLYLIFLVLILIVIYSAYISVHSFFLFSSAQKIIGVIGLLLALFGVGSAYFYIWFTKKFNRKIDDLIKNIDSAKLGEEGENQVKDELHKILDDKIFYIKHGFKFKDKKFDIDFIVVGPKGIIVFEVKKFTHKLKFYSKTVNYIIDGKEYRSGKDPRKALHNYAKELSDYLCNKGKEFENLLIEKAVIITDESKVEIATSKTGMYIIRGVGRIKEYLDSLKENPDYDASFCYKIEKALEDKS